MINCSYSCLVRRNKKDLYKLILIVLNVNYSYKKWLTKWTVLKIIDKNCYWIKQIKIATDYGKVHDKKTTKAYLIKSLEWLRQF